MSARPATRSTLIWVGLAAALVVPLAVSATSPLLAWREPVYVAAGLAGVIGLCLLLVQPLLAGGALPGLTARRSAGIHRVIGVALVAAVLVHVGGLWLTSPPDVVDALLFRSATPFSIWGVLAMWAVTGTALLTLTRRRVPVRTLRVAHTTLAAVTVAGTIAHALLIDGTMGQLSKAMLCVLVATATARVILIKKAWRARAGTPARAPTR